MQLTDKQKVWKKLFKSLNGKVKVKKIDFLDRTCNVSYSLPHSSTKYEFAFNVDDEVQKVKSEFRKDVRENARYMIVDIEKY